MTLSGAAAIFQKTRAEINLGALEHNYRYLRSRIDEGVKVIAVVKADAYGHGAETVSKTLASMGVDSLAVATMDEAVALRKEGIESPIIVFGGALPGEEAAAIHYGVLPAVHSIEALGRLSQSAKALGMEVGYHLKVDTGMGRVGIDYRHLGMFLDHAMELPSVRLEGVFTHLSSADEDSSDYSSLQLERFRSGLEEIYSRNIEVGMVHAANSAGVLFHPESWFDAVRPGVALYGINPSSNWQDPELHPVLSFKSSVSLIKKVPAGSPLSYGRTFVTERDSVIASVPVGYADGLSFLLSNRGSVIVRDTLAPIVGRITMDTTLVDVTDVPGVSFGDEVMLIGESSSVSITAEGIAETIGTIPYEVLCNISKRVPRAPVKSTLPMHDKSGEALTISG